MVFKHGQTWSKFSNIVKCGQKWSSIMFKYGENQTFYHTWLNMVFNKNIEKHDKQDQTY